MAQKIKVGHKIYAIKKARPILADEAADGECVHEKNLMVIDSTLKGTEYVETLLHEIFHACWYVWDIGEDNKVTEEEVVSRLAKATTTVFVDNQKLLDHIKENLWTLKN